MINGSDHTTVSLASCLLDLPIEPKLGKMVLYGVVLKCLDPILTIVCCISYKDPFTLTAANSSERRSRDIAKEILAAVALLVPPFSRCCFHQPGVR